jgi:hypothetical protein
MPYASADLEVYQGSDYAGSVTIALPDGVPVDLAGYTAVAQIRRTVADHDPVIAAEMGTAIDSPSVRLWLTHEQTQPLYGRYRWDLRLVGQASEVITVMNGNVIVTSEVTRI